MYASYDLLFLWDSVGSVPCKMTFEGKGGKMHNAATLADKIGMGLNQRIGKSRRQDSKYTNTLVVVNQPWVELPDNPFGQPKIKAKGGESLWLNSTLVFRFGNQKNGGTTNITAVKEKRKVEPDLKELKKASDWAERQERIAEENANIQRVDAQVKGVKKW